eukprot:sb/3475448/
MITRNRPIYCNTSKQPIRTRYLDHVTGYRPIRDQYFLIRSVPGSYPHHIKPLNFQGLFLSTLCRFEQSQSFKNTQYKRSRAPVSRRNVSVCLMSAHECIMTLNLMRRFSVFQRLMSAHETVYHERS